jgi:hypothetical protein
MNQTPCPRSATHLPRSNTLMFQDKPTTTSVVHVYPQPQEPKRTHLRLQPGVIDFGQRTSSLQWLWAHRACAALKLVQILFIAGLVSAGVFGLTGWLLRTLRIA